MDGVSKLRHSCGDLAACMWAAASVDIGACRRTFRPAGSGRRLIADLGRKFVRPTYMAVNGHVMCERERQKGRNINGKTILMLGKP